MFAKQCRRGALRVSAAFLLTLAGAAQATPLLIDGDTSDWGPVVADNNASVFSFNPGIGLLGTMIEDQDDLADDGGFLGPDQGGQDYDAEAFALAIQGGTLYGLLVTGLRPDNSFERFSPGDIMIQTTGGLFAIEVGGGPGGGLGGPITEGANGSTYELSGFGVTVSHQDEGATQPAGSIWMNPSLLADPVGDPILVQIDPAAPGTHVGTVDYIFTRDALTTQHSVIEFSLPLSVFGNASLVEAIWRPSCGNDELIVVPEPAALVLMLAAAPALLRRRRS